MKSYRKIVEAYAKSISEQKLLRFIGKRSAGLGSKIVYSGLLLFYAYNRDETPSWAKRVIVGTIGYLITPIDAIPDLTPVLGYTDDLSMLSFGLVTIASYINEDIRKKSKEKLSNWFPKWDQSELIAIDETL